MKRTRSTFLALVAVLLTPMAANAAFITIDDSDEDFITITAGDFEGCFWVNYEELTCGLYDSNSITLPDGDIHSFWGYWIDLGESNTFGEQSHFFGLMDTVYSGIQWTAEYGYIDGLFVGFDPSETFGAFPGVSPQDGSAFDFSQPYSLNTFISEAVSVPEPSTLALLGIGLVGIGLARRRRS